MKKYKILYLMNCFLIFFLQSQNYSQTKIKTEASPNEITTFLENEVVKWADGKDLDDDITFIVVKVK